MTPRAFPVSPTAVARFATACLLTATVAHVASAQPSLGDQLSRLS